MPMIADFCEQVVAHDLPELPPDRRDATVAFAGRRIAGLPVADEARRRGRRGVVGAAGRLVGTGSVVGVLARHPLPVFGEYVRLVRSLTYAYVWETWPDTAASGRPLEVAP